MPKEVGGYTQVSSIPAIQVNSARERDVVMSSFQSGGGYAVGRKATQIRRPVAGQDVTQKVVVDDD